MSNKILTTFDLSETHGNLSKIIVDSFNRANSMWHSLIRLLITLSSSFLLATIALAKDIFDLSSSDIHKSLPLFLILGWIGYFCTIVFGVFAEINEVIFEGSNARRNADLARDIRAEISKGKTVAAINDDVAYISNSFLLGAACIDFFILSTMFLCLSFLKDFISEHSSYWTVTISSFSLFLMNAYFIKKRSNYSRATLIKTDN